VLHFDDFLPPRKMTDLGIEESGFDFFWKIFKTTESLGPVLPKAKKKKRNCQIS
jgi:hypothetical protein